MRYRATSIAVDAFVIIGVRPISPTGPVDVELDSGTCIRLTAAMIARYRPLPGDVFIKHQDGYEEIKPKDVFEKQYRPTPK